VCGACTPARAVGNDGQEVREMQRIARCPNGIPRAGGVAEVEPRGLMSRLGDRSISERNHARITSGIISSRNASHDPTDHATAFAPRERRPSFSRLTASSARRAFRARETI